MSTQILHHYYKPTTSDMPNASKGDQMGLLTGMQGFLHNSFIIPTKSLDMLQLNREA